MGPPETGIEGRNNMTSSMVSQTQTPLFLTLIFSMAMGVAMGIEPVTTQDTRELSPFGRHFWSTADRQHYRVAENGEVAELVLDKVAGNY